MKNTRKHNAKINPESTPAAKAIRCFNQLTMKQLVYKFKNAQYVCKKSRPYQDYVSLCYLDESKALILGSSIDLTRAQLSFPIL